MTGFVYAIVAENGLVKIGWSKDPIERVYSLQTDCPLEVRLVGAVAGSRKQEREIQTLLAPWRRRREWFALEGPVEAFVQMLPRPVPKVVVETIPDHPFAAWLFRRRMTQTSAAKALGVSTAHMSGFLHGDGISGELAERIVIFTSGEVRPNDFLSLESRQKIAAAGASQ